MLREILVCGVTDGRLQHRLLAEPELILKGAVNLSHIRIDDWSYH